MKKLVDFEKECQIKLEEREHKADSKRTQNVVLGMDQQLLTTKNQVRALGSTQMIQQQQLDAMNKKLDAIMSLCQAIIKREKPA